MADRPPLADSPELAERLRRGLLQRHQGVVLLDGPGANPAAGALLRRLGFAPISETLCKYRGPSPRLEGRLFMGWLVLNWSERGGTSDMGRSDRWCAVLRNPMV